MWDPRGKGPRSKHVSCVKHRFRIFIYPGTQVCVLTFWFLSLFTLFLIYPQPKLIFDFPKTNPDCCPFSIDVSQPR